MLSTVVELGAGLEVDVDSVVEEEVEDVEVSAADEVVGSEEDVGSGVTPTGPCVEAISAGVVEVEEPSPVDSGVAEVPDVSVTSL